MNHSRKPICPDSRKCFARSLINPERCAVLQFDDNGHFYTADGECPFCKPDREVTDGKTYLRDPYYTTTVFQEEGQ